MGTVKVTLIMDGFDPGLIPNCDFVCRKRILVQTQTRNCTTMLEKYKELKNRDSAMNATFDVPDLLQSDAHGNGNEH